MTEKEFYNLKTGDVVRHVAKTEIHVVTANYGLRVTAVRSVDMTNASEWELVTKRPASTERQLRELAELVEAGWAPLSAFGNGWEYRGTVDGRRCGAVTQGENVGGQWIDHYVGEFEARYPLMTEDQPGPCMVRRVS